ncbi:hypothetical protein OK074_6040 [Actinobacteria bacterium OK074]|nr:hypothetical protein OK074_6040 [Actinobacteria bacterium OK074]
MTNFEYRTTENRTPWPFPEGEGAIDADGDGLAALVGDGARMAPHWNVAVTAEADVPAVVPVSPSRILGVRVPAASARLVGAMPEYAD